MSDVVKDKRKVGDLRPSQLLHTFGVGAIIELPNLSVMVMGLEDWPVEQGASEINEPRLLRAVQQELGSQVVKLLTPPVTPESTGSQANPFDDTASVGVDSSKANALSAIAESIAKLAESSNDRTLYDKTFGFIEGFRDDDSRDKVLDVILSSKVAIADVGRLRSLTTHYGVGAGKARALARILMACSHPELIGKKEKAGDDNDR